ncbi:hypothetical protein Lfu02_71620 [Longispora fulva]|uniref:Xanthosine utilization system XapX-like protein n=1 Tax=Longispora fulva TaxID=619741 RepID=A0A8J7KN42_9ACTN|nr:hypothetical protein [Longispora fulva]MBG6141214.1 xanthosine utilization system XapX-like protein [Longispora fulva]GIG62790.1 hypothetical protein Lfu02_71620 [Longispora fulva]
MSIVLLALAGILFGGAWSLQQQDRPKPVIAIVGLLGVLSLLGGILWMLPK